MEEYQICESCNGKMLPILSDRKFVVNGTVFFIRNVPVFKCNKCGNIVYSFEVAQRLQDLFSSRAGCGDILIISSF